MPLQATSGAASYDAFGGGVPVVPNYIEECFSCFLYTGTDTTSTGVLSINNSIDLAGKGGLVWIKARNTTTSQALFDTTRGTNKLLTSNSTAAQTDESPYTLGAFNANGFSLGSATLGSYALVNGVGNTYASWTFRKQPKFFDVVTYTGNGAASRNIAHSLGSDPGCIIVKRTSAANDWSVYHRSTGTGKRLILNDTLAVLTDADMFASVTSTTFSVSGNTDLNDNGATYVAYLFAHDAGGFGLTGTDNVISCGSLVGGSVQDINLGYEPQWILYKNASSGTAPWGIHDTMRGMPTDGVNAYLLANTSGAEATATAQPSPLATGFRWNYTGNSGSTFIYIAIRRGPMKVPTSGTSVYNGITRTGTGAVANITGAGFPPDLVIAASRTASYNHGVFDKLRGPLLQMDTQATRAESSTSGSLTSFDMDGFSTALDNNGSYGGTVNANGQAKINYLFRRAPSFFDEVCYTATISAEQTFNHNLGVTPELIFLKRRDSARNWVCWQYQGTNGLTGTGQFLNLNLTAEANASTTYNDGYVYGVSATQFAVNGFSSFNNVNSSCVAYLFATCAGVSKCFSYTGNGSSQTINCGFTGGARFVLIKRTDSTGDWYVWDTARGIVSGNDPHLSLNTTAAEVTSDDTIDTDSTGFVVNQLSATNVNVSSATYIGLAIA
jgi:hypothetical protein